MISAALRRWRGRIALMASAALLAGAWAFWWSWADRWPARLELRAAGATVPLAFSPDGRAFATADFGAITLWDATTGRRLATWGVRPDGFAQAGAFSPDGKTFAAAVSRYPAPMQLALIDVASGRTTSTLTSRHTNIFGPGVGFGDDGGQVSLLSADTSQFREVATWDAATGSAIPGRPLPLLMKIPERPLAVSPDRRLLVSTSTPGGLVWLRDLEDAARRPEPVGEAEAALAEAATFSDDGRTLAIGRRDGSVDLHEVASRRPIGTLRAHNGGRYSVSLRFAPDGRTIASRGVSPGPTGLSLLLHDLDRFLFGGRNPPPGEVVVLDVATGERLARSGTSIQPFFSPDGRTVATRDVDGPVRLRDVPAPEASPPDRAGAR